MTQFKKKYSGQSFRKAARKHLKTCEEIANHLSTVRNSEDKKMLLADLYYLSGYVLECVYKFGILSAMGKGRDQLNKNHLESHGLKTHDIAGLRQTYIESARKQQSKMSHFHFLNWDVQIRYLSPSEIEDLDERKILDYLENCVKTEFNNIYSDY